MSNAQRTQRPVVAITLALGMAVCLLLSQPASALTEQVGGGLINRAAVDGASNYLFMHDNGTATPGFTLMGNVTHFAIFNNNGAGQGGRTFEPVLFQDMGATWEVTGVGATVTAPASMNGVYWFNFDTVSGTSEVAPGFTFAHHDLNNPGTIEYSDAVGVGLQRFVSRSGAKEADGNSINDGSFSGRNRIYSIQFKAIELDVNSETLGDALIDRPNNDGANGGLFMTQQPFSFTGTVKHWSIFDNDGTTLEITPIILEQVGTEFFIRGVGQTRTSDGSGIQVFDFDLTAGSAQVDGEGLYFLGWKDGSATANNTGVVDWSSGSTDGGIRYFGVGHVGNLTIDRNLGGGQWFDRDYSIQFFAQGPVPEPATLGLVGLGAIALLRRVRRRA